MTQPTYDELLHYSYALETTLGQLLQAALSFTDVRHDVELVQAVDKAMTLSIRADLPDGYQVDVQTEIQRLHTHIPGVK
jgi:hypothetical protein